MPRSSRTGSSPGSARPVSANADAYDAAIAADRAAVDNARIQLGYCYIHSPIDGRTGNLAVKIGNLVKANDVPILVTINQITPILVTFTFRERAWRNQELSG